jgi:hypothetical protein
LGITSIIRVIKYSTKYGLEAKVNLRGIAAFILITLGLSFLMVRTDVLPASILRLIPALIALGIGLYLAVTVIMRIVRRKRGRRQP